MRDSGEGTNVGLATAFHCSNVSGVSASVRFQVLHAGGATIGSSTLVVPHGETIAVSTHLANSISENVEISPFIVNARGAINIESTQSGVFCSGVVLDASAAVPNGVELRLVRVNPHPGTVE